ncbi:hypothetical protein HZH66_005033 [Vespula vulgaris]|uniref:Uncharacterized protein n=2 Tax=Vespula TaxID=7451 RepID=A0A834UBU7_VESPE|nr:hypothetical protein HZH66_005033 [Vespula vulgaris]KAF7429646.1 hypothetical protein H0235_006044 [Vespula pensylvanica]
METRGWGYEEYEESLAVANSNKNSQYVDCWWGFSGITLFAVRKTRFRSSLLEFPVLSFWPPSELPLWNLHRRKLISYAKTNQIKVSELLCSTKKKNLPAFYVPTTKMFP